VRKKDRHELPSPIQPQLVLSLCARFLKKGTIVLEIAVKVEFPEKLFQARTVIAKPDRRLLTQGAHAAPGSRRVWVLDDGEGSREVERMN
jgi:hypothetical protein